jgi:mono/diheme cytochrome c family protein
LAACLLSGCQQQMARQPAYRPLEASPFFADGRSARPVLPGTVARDSAAPEALLVSGLQPLATDAAGVVGLVGSASGGWNALVPPGRPADPAAAYVTTFPFRITRAVLERGQERFRIYCAMCHDPLGTGHGKIVERGYLQPPSYHTDYSRGFERRGFKVRLRDAPVGYYFEVITHGFGGMPDYASQVPPADRWRIIAYIRALQLSQRVPLADLPPEERQAARQALEGTP